MIEIRQKDESHRGYFPLEDFLFFDIETMGLSAKYYPIRMMSYLHQQGEKITSTQVFAHSKEDEVLLLADAIKRFSQKKVPVHFNGKSFDIPFMNQRMKASGLHYEIDTSQTIDIYHLACAKKDLYVKKKSLQSLENHFHIQRQDTLDGGNWVESLKSYDKGSKKVLDDLYLHNYEDVINLPLLIEKLQLKEELFSHLILDKLFLKAITGNEFMRVLLSENTVIDLPIVKMDSLIFLNTSFFNVEFDTLENHDKKKYLLGYGRKQILPNIKHAVELASKWRRQPDSNW